MSINGPITGLKTVVAMSTVIVDMTHHHRNSDIPARLLDVVEGRSADALRHWLAHRHPACRQPVRIVAWTDSKAMPPQVRNFFPPPGE